MNILKDIQLKNLSTFKVEAKAKYFVEITNEKDIRDLIDTDIFKNNSHYILGKGANTLFSKNFDGLIIKISMDGKEILSKNKTSILLKIGAGEDWTKLVEYTVNNNWSGLENLAWIPGTAGAAPVQNIGAYGRELSDVFEYLEAIDLESGQKVVFNKEECEFGYRDSIFKREAKGKYIITSIVIKLEKADNKIYLSSSSQYNSLKSELELIGKEPYTLRIVHDAVVNLRTKKLPSIEEYGSNGSFFENPIITSEQLEKIQNTFSDIPYFDTDNPNLFKIPSGWILEALGWKGKRIGDVGTWINHALIIVNYGSATGKEILNFANKMEDDFFNKTGITLEPESNII